MPRRYGRKHIRSFTVPNYGKVDLYYWSETKMFQTKIFDLELQDATEDALVKRIHAEIKQRSKLDWQPVIRVYAEFVDPDSDMRRARRDDDNTVKLNFERFYVAILQDGSPVQHRWHCHPSDDEELDCDQPATEFVDKWPGRGEPWRGETIYWYKGNGVFAIPINDGNYQYIAYTPERWRGLQLLEEKLRELRRRLSDLLTTDEGHQQLEKAAQLLLPAGKEKARG